MWQSWWQIKILTRSPSQYPDYETSDEILSIDEYKDCVIYFDDMLENKQNDISPFVTRGRHEGTDVYYLSQRNFELPLLIRDNSSIIIWFTQTAKTVQQIFNDLAGFDMSYDEFKELCREAWKEKYYYLKINKIDDEEEYCICNESKKEYKIFKPQTNPLWKILHAFLSLNNHICKVYQLLLLIHR